jgi:peptide deformylase
VVREILLLGNPLLHEISADVKEEELDSLHAVVEDLHDTLMAFRKKYGVGRAISAPQIGVMKRLVYMHIYSPTVFINPTLKEMSHETFELWDDCMSFPDLYVKVARHKSCIIEYRDLAWKLHEEFLVDDLSELLQHEVDHLDGILATARAIDGQSFSIRGQAAHKSEK